MSLIESLRNEVRDKESEHAAQIAEREAQQAYYQEYLRPAMQRAQTYFSEVIANLKFLDTNTPVGLPISPDQTSLVSMKQGGYDFFYDDAKNPVCLDIVCECALAEPQRFHLSTPEMVEHYTEFLNSIQFPHHRKTQLDRRYDIRSATFDMEGPLKVGVRIKASAADRCIYIYLQNLENMPRKRYQFAPEKIDAALLERLAKLILRQESKLVSIELCPEVRDGLRHQVEAEKAQREADLVNAMAELRLREQAELEARKLSTRLRSFTSTIRSGLSVAVH